MKTKKKKTICVTKHAYLKSEKPLIIGSAIDSVATAKGSRCYTKWVDRTANMELCCNETTHLTKVKVPAEAMENKDTYDDKIFYAHHVEVVSCVDMCMARRYFGAIIMVKALKKLCKKHPELSIALEFYTSRLNGVKKKVVDDFDAYVRSVRPLRPRPPNGMHMAMMMGCGGMHPMMMTHHVRNMGVKAIMGGDCGCEMPSYEDMIISMINDKMEDVRKKVVDTMSGSKLFPEIKKHVQCLEILKTALDKVDEITGSKLHPPIDLLERISRSFSYNYQNEFISLVSAITRYCDTGWYENNKTSTMMEEDEKYKGDTNVEYEAFIERLLQFSADKKIVVSEYGNINKAYNEYFLKKGK